MTNCALANSCSADYKCATCDTSNKICTACWPNYALRNDRCVMDIASVSNCEVFHANDSSKCAICKEGYVGKWDDSACATSYTMNQAGTPTSINPMACTNCRSCKLLRWEIAAGSYDTAVNKNMQCLICSENYFGFVAPDQSCTQLVNSATINPQIQNCKYHFATSNECYECSLGYMLSYNRQACLQVTSTTTYPQNCMQLDFNTLYCKKCQSGSPMLSEELCKSNLIAVCMIGFTIVWSLLA